MAKGTIELVIADNPKEQELPLALLTSFFTALEAAYQIAGNVVEDENDKPSRGWTRVRALERLRQTSLEGLSAGLPGIVLSEISYNSPLTAKFRAAINALAFAVALSGGTIEYTPGGGFKATVPSLGSALAAIRIACSGDPSLLLPTPPASSTLPSTAAVSVKTPPAKTPAPRRNKPR